MNEEEYKNKENGGDIPDEGSTNWGENGRNECENQPLCCSLDEDVKKEGGRLRAKIGK